MPATSLAGDADRWLMPEADDYNWKFYDSYSRHTVIDLDGDGYLDFVDSEDQSTASASDAFEDGRDLYWKVYRGG